MKVKIFALLIISLLFFFISCEKEENKNNLIGILESEKYALFSKEDKVFFLDSISKKIIKMPKDSIAKNLAFKISAEYYYLNDIGYDRKEWIEKLKEINSLHYKEQKDLYDMEQNMKKYNL